MQTLIDCISRAQTIESDIVSLKAPDEVTILSAEGPFSTAQVYFNGPTAWIAANVVVRLYARMPSHRKALLGIVPLTALQPIRPSSTIPPPPTAAVVPMSEPPPSRRRGRSSSVEPPSPRAGRGAPPPSPSPMPSRLNSVLPPPKNTAAEDVTFRLISVRGVAVSGLEVVVSQDADGTPVSDGLFILVASAAANDSASSGRRGRVRITMEWVGD